MNDATNISSLFAAPEDGVEPRESRGADVPKIDVFGPDDVEQARLRSLPVNELVLEYLGNRDRLDNERHAFQRTEKEIKATLEVMSMIMREKADALGVDAFPIRGVGTAYRNQKVSYRTGDWSTFIEWIDKTKNFQCLEKRVAKLATAEVEKATGEVPPGVEKIVEVEFLVRRNKA